MGDSPQDRRSSRRSRNETSYKAKAFEKFKQLKKGVKNKYAVDEVENVYEVVEEKEYVKEVLSRYDDDWIVDDDGSGYIEDGRDIFDDDLDLESIAKASSSGKGTKRKNKNVSKNAGKGNLQQMLSTMPTKKKKEINIDEDETLNELLSELNSDATPSTSVPKPKINQYSALAKKLVAKNYLKNVSQPIKKRAIEIKSVTKQNLTNNSSAVLKEDQTKLSSLKNSQTKHKNLSELENIPKQINRKEIIDETPQEENLDETPQEENLDETLTDQFEKDQLVIEDFDDTPSELLEHSTNTNGSEFIDFEMTQDDFENDLDITKIEELESQFVEEGNKLAEEFQAEFENEWEAFANSTINVENDSSLDNTDVPLVQVDGKKVFRFFWWDAYEDPVHQKGTVFLFGKTYCEKLKRFLSCCVVVKNIDRRVFVLPRPFELDNEGNPTEIPVTFKKVYEEFNETILKPLRVKVFRSKPTTKKYAFDPEIPTESEYMEVRYPASDPRIDADHLPKKIRTFSKIFGVNSSFLEILFLDRKIKGPCWLDISSPALVSNPVSWCKFEINCTKVMDLNVTVLDKPLPPPPLVVAALNMRTCINKKTCTHEIVMMSCLAHNQYAVDKQPPVPPFEQHFCAVSCPTDQILPPNMHNALSNYKATKAQKMDSERALLNYFINQFIQIDPDLIVGYDLQGYQINILAERLTKLRNNLFSKLGKLKRSETKGLEKVLFAGRLVCDMKISSKELIKSRSYDLDTLCQVVLKIKENQRIELEPEEVRKMFNTIEDTLKLISCTMQDTMYIMKMMYNLNVIPLALQITNIAGNVMSKTLLGGRSERNEFLLLHAFSEKGYILPDKEYKWKGGGKQTAKRKPAYAGGLVLDPKVGFYDKLILLMDFNSLYPSIIQEYNICFTTLPTTNDLENLYLPDSSLPPGILPTEIRKLVESRRQVKSLMKKPDLSDDLRMQYNIRQMALKLTANSMYGCLGFSYSRFYAKNLAALVTQKGREILTITKTMIEKMMFDVVYGDTDSIMINTNILEYDEVFKIGLKIKQEVNKLYKQVELDIDGVFKYLLLLKKKKYAAVTLTKDNNGSLVEVREYKGLDIVRRDWSQLACGTGEYVLEQILNDQPLDDKIQYIHDYLRKIREDLIQGQVPIQLLMITKQLAKDPHMYPNKESLPHVQVAIRYNKESNGHLRAGDTVNYLICKDGTTKTAMQRAYHVDELKTNKALKIDYDYYLEQQIHPVVTRIIEPIDGTDSYQIAECLGMDLKNLKKPAKSVEIKQITGENFRTPEVKFRHSEKFKFICDECKTENVAESPLVGGIPFLARCRNSECKIRPVNYLHSIQNQLALSMRHYICKYYRNTLTCEDPTCTNETPRLPLLFSGKYPVCTSCKRGCMYKIYNENELHNQIGYFQHIFDLSKLKKKPVMEQEIEYGYQALLETVGKYSNQSGYSTINLREVFNNFEVHTDIGPHNNNNYYAPNLEDLDDYSDDDDT